MNTMVTPYKTFRLGGTKYTVTTRDRMTNDEFSDALNFTRRAVGYIVYPRWAAARLLLVECVEQIYRKRLMMRGVKHWTGEVLRKMDALERIHKTDFNEEFLDTTAYDLAEKALPKLHQLRVDIGGILLNHKVGEYIFFQYPETFLMVANDNVVTFHMLMREIKKQKGCDFTEVFKPLAGEEVFRVGCRWLSELENVLREKLPVNVDANGTVAQERLAAFDRIITDGNNVIDSIHVGQNESPDDEREDILRELDNDISKENKERLSTKFKVTEL